MERWGKLAVLQMPGDFTTRPETIQGNILQRRIAVVLGEFEGARSRAVGHASVHHRRKPIAETQGTGTSRLVSAVLVKHSRGPSLGQAGI